MGCRAPVVVVGAVGVERIRSSHRVNISDLKACPMSRGPIVTLDVDESSLSEGVLTHACMHACMVAWDVCIYVCNGWM